MFAFLFLGIAAFSQKQIVSQFNSWFIYQGNHRLTEKWGLHTEYQFRRNDFLRNWQQSLLRLGVDYYLKNGAMATAGYGWIETFPYGLQPIAYSFTEHRIWEQFQIQHKAGRFNFQHRYRLEQRFLEKKLADSSGVFLQDGYNFRNRFRYRGMVTIPINHREMKDHTLFLSLYDELFLGYGKGIAKNILDQNRLSFSLGWRFNQNLNVQLGYLNQFVVKPDGLMAERNHTLTVFLGWNMDFRKPAE